MWPDSVHDSRTSLEGSKLAIKSNFCFDVDIFEVFRVTLGLAKSFWRI